MYKFYAYLCSFLCLHKLCTKLCVLPLNKHTLIQKLYSFRITLIHPNYHKRLKKSAQFIGGLNNKNFANFR